MEEMGRRGPSAACSGAVARQPGWWGQVVGGSGGGRGRPVSQVSRGPPSCVWWWDPALVFLVARLCLSLSGPWTAYATLSRSPRCAWLPPLPVAAGLTPDPAPPTRSRTGDRPRPLPLSGTEPVLSHVGGVPGRVVREGEGGNRQSWTPS